MAPCVIVIGGAPGVGKSTVARALARRVDGCHIEIDRLAPVASDGAGPSSSPRAADRHEAMVRAGAEAGVSLARDGLVAVVDFVLGPWHIDLVVTRCSGRGVGCHYVVLRPDEVTALRRARGRGMGSGQLETVRYLVDAFGDLDDLDDHAVDTTDLGIDETVSAVLDGVSGGCFRLV